MDIRPVLIRATLGCLVFIPLVDAWMWILARLVPGAGRPAAVALIAALASAIALIGMEARLCAWRRRRMQRRRR